MSRRKFAGGIVGAAAVAATPASAAPGFATASSKPAGRQIPDFQFEHSTIADLGAGLRSRRWSARELASAYLNRIQSIDTHGPSLKSVIRTNPDALSQAAALDRELKSKGPRSPLHGIPVLVKDNIDVAGPMPTTAGSLALASSCAVHDAFIIARLRAAGAVILGKTNLSEWANFRGSRSISGWSGAGGQTRNPHVLDRSPSGSSSGSGAAVAASLCAVAIGTETDGSIISPSSFCGIVGLKPTVGLVSRSGIIPISSSQDTAGPMARTVADAAVLLDVLAAPDPADVAPLGYQTGVSTALSFSQAVEGATLRGVRIGVMRSAFGIHPRVDRCIEESLRILKSEGAELIDPVEPPDRKDLGDKEFLVMLFEFKAGLNAYLRSLPDSVHVRSLDDLIRFNEKHADRELPFFGQQTLIAAAAKAGLDHPDYLDARNRCIQWSRTQGIDAMLARHRLDAIVAPSGGMAHTVDHLTGDRWLGGSSTLPAVAGYPNITVPCGSVFGLPVGISFFSGAWKDAALLRIARGFERAAQARIVPRFLPTLELGSLV